MACISFFFPSFIGFFPCVMKGRVVIASDILVGDRITSFFFKVEMSGNLLPHL